jgi:cyclic-di-GMP phosphodiesterase, flagellum assembly factor TipF
VEDLPDQWITKSMLDPAATGNDRATCQASNPRAQKSAAFAPRWCINPMHPPVDNLRKHGCRFAFAALGRKAHGIGESTGWLARVMTSEPEIQALDGPPRAGRLGDIVIVSAMILVAIAVSIGLSLHLGLPITRSAIAGGMILALLLGLHFFILRLPKGSTEAPDLMDEAMWQELKARRAVATDAPVADTDAADPSSAPGMSDGPVAEAAPNAPSTRPSRIVAAPPLPTLSADNTQQSFEDKGQWSDRVAEGLRGSFEPEAEHADISAGTPGPMPTQASATTMEAPVPNEAQSIESYWSYRPRTADNEPSLTASAITEPTAGPDLGGHNVTGPGGGPTDIEAGHQQQTLAASPSPEPPANQLETSQADAATPESVPVSPRAHDVELVQRMIKKLAQDVNAAELLARGASADADGASPANAQARAANAETASATGIATSVEALRTTSGVMRGRPSAAPVPPQSREDQQRYRRVNELSEAIADNRLAVQLEPVMGLEDHRARHFEVTIKVKSGSGAMLAEAEAGKTFEGTGLLPQFDRERLTKTRAVATQLGQRGKVGGVFSHIFGESLTDREFCFNVAASGIADESFAKRLILTLPQAHARIFGPGQWQTLHEFRELGFRFALSDVTDLDMDFERLVAAGCAFIKLDADVFFQGLHVADGGFVPADDITRYLRSLGVSVIVENIGDADKLSRAYDSGVLLGQGQLFGGPRTLKADAITNGDHQAA